MKPVEEAVVLPCDGSKPSVLPSTRETKKASSAGDVAEDRTWRPGCNNARGEVITPLDVICGRGKPYQEHPGNKQMRQLVKELNGRYQTAVHNQKVFVAEEVLRGIKDLGGRFLKKQAEKYWVEVSHSVAVEKISHSFRAMRRKGKSIPRQSATTSAREQVPRILHASTPRHLAAATEEQPNLANTFNTLPLLQYPLNNLVAQYASRARPYDLLLALQERAAGILMVPHMQVSYNAPSSIPRTTMATSTFVERELSRKEIESWLLKKQMDEAMLAGLRQYSAPKP
jgi:hypothetical protein